MIYLYVVSTYIKITSSVYTNCLYFSSKKYESITLLKLSFIIIDLGFQLYVYISIYMYKLL